MIIGVMEKNELGEGHRPREGWDGVVGYPPFHW